MKRILILLAFLVLAGPYQALRADYRLESQVPGTARKQAEEEKQHQAEATRIAAKEQKQPALSAPSLQSQFPRTAHLVMPAGNELVATLSIENAELVIKLLRKRSHWTQWGALPCENRGVLASEIRSLSDISERTFEFVCGKQGYLSDHTRTLTGSIDKIEMEWFYDWEPEGGLFVFLPPKEYTEFQFARHQNVGQRFGTGSWLEDQTKDGDNGSTKGKEYGDIASLRKEALGIAKVKKQAEEEKQHKAEATRIAVKENKQKEQEAGNTDPLAQLWWTKRITAPEQSYLFFAAWPKGDSQYDAVIWRLKREIDHDELDGVWTGYRFHSGSSTRSTIDISGSAIMVLEDKSLSGGGRNALGLWLDKPKHPGAFSSTGRRDEIGQLYFYSSHEHAYFSCVSGPCLGKLKIDQDSVTPLKLVKRGKGFFWSSANNKGSLRIRKNVRGELMISGKDFGGIGVDVTSNFFTLETPLHDADFNRIIKDNFHQDVPGDSYPERFERQIAALLNKQYPTGKGVLNADSTPEESPLTADEVIALQKALAFFGLYKGGIDGDAGPNTQSAINQWLRKQGRSPETLRLSLAEEITTAAKTEKALIAKAEEEKQRQAEAERQLAAAKEAEARRKAEEEERRQLAAAKEAEAKRKAEEARQKAEEERRQAEAVRLAAEKERKEQEEKARQLALAKEAEAKRKAEEEKQKQAELAAIERMATSTKVAIKADVAQLTSSPDPAAESNPAATEDSITQASQPTEADKNIELEFWQSIKDGDDADMYQAYLNQFPSGVYAELARIKIKKLGGTTTSVAQSSIPTLDYGDYYALVIGNNEYQDLTNLRSAVNDAKVVSTVLEVDYGFNVKLLENASRKEILRSLKHLRQSVSAKDNVLIYYAGHGYLDKDTDYGYWLPVDSERDDDSNWIATDRVVSQVKGMKAKHVMVVADSCFSGTITRGLKITERTPEWLATIIKKKARTALTSGGLEPVLDTGSGNHSAFAYAFISLLEENDGVLDASELFSQLRPKVMMNSTQTPQYGNIHQAGHDGGDFLFVRQ